MEVAERARAMVAMVAAARAAAAKGLTAVERAAARAGALARDPTDELCNPHAQTTLWHGQARCTECSGPCHVTCTGHCRLGLRRAKCVRSTRSRRLPRTTVRTLAQCQGSSTRCPTACCRQCPGRSPHPERQTAR